MTKTIPSFTLTLHTGRVRVPFKTLEGALQSARDAEMVGREAISIHCGPDVLLEAGELRREMDIAPALVGTVMPSRAHSELPDSRGIPDAAEV